MVGRHLFLGLVAATAFVLQGANAALDVDSPGVFKTVAGPSSSGARISSSDETDPDQTPGLNVVPKAYIIELEPKAKSLDGRSEGNTHARFHKRAEEENVDYRVRREFTDASLFHGLSIDVESDEDLEALERLPEVKKVWPVVEMSLPKPVGIPSLSELNITAEGHPGEGYSTEIIRGENYKIDYNLKMAGVEHLHSHGFKGKGIKIAIIDSGVDYYHPAFGGGFGPGKKIAFGRNYVDDGQGGPDDPIATCHGGGHGTHVAGKSYIALPDDVDLEDELTICLGTIGGQDPKDYGFGLLGVAPEATLGMYRVFSCGGGASNDVVLQSMIDAYNDGADIVSMSLGSDNGFEDVDPFGQIVTNAKKRGIATVVAAGNAGFLGPVLTGSPAIAKDAIAVASTDAARFPTTYKMKGSTGREEWRYSSLWPLEGEFPIFASGDEEESYGCDYDILLKAVAEVQERGWDLENTFYMVRQSTRCDVGSMMINAVYQGFKGVVWWRGEEFSNPYDNDYPSSIGGQFLLGLDHVDGPKLYKAVTSDPLKFRAKFTDKRFLPVENPSAGFTSNYSTFGNTWEYKAFKPLLAAPGHLILSAWPLETGGYAIISGTSMGTFG
jgi:subtilisin family serine protease